MMEKNNADKLFFIRKRSDNFVVDSADFYNQCAAWNFEIEPISDRSYPQSQNIYGNAIDKCMDIAW